MLTIFLILALLALGLTIASAVNPPRAPLWIAVLILCLMELLRVLPLGR